MKNECLRGSNRSFKLFSLVDMMKFISVRSHLIQDSCYGKNVMNVVIKEMKHPHMNKKKKREIVLCSTKIYF